MDVLCIEYDRKKKGLNIDKIAHMFEFGGTTQVYKLISSLEKKEYIKRKGNEIVISREGKKKLFSFREDGNKQSKKEFSSQIPIDYYNDTKIKEIEVFIGTFFLLSLSVLFIYALTIILEKTGELSQLLTIIFIIIFLFVGIILFFSFFFVYVLMWNFIITGIGIIVEPISFEIGFYIRKNVEKISKIAIIILAVIGTGIAWGLAGIKGLLGGVIMTFIIELFLKREKVIEFLKNKLRK